VPGGFYVLKAFSQLSDGVTATATLPVNITSDRADLRMVLAPTSRVPINVRSEATHTPFPGTFPKEMQPVNIQLMPQETMFANQTVWASFEGPPENRTFVLRNVEPGTYKVQFQPNGPWYIDSARCGNVDLLSTSLTVAAGASLQPFEIVLRDDFASLKGTVYSEGTPALARVLVFAEHDLERSWQVFVAPNGEFVWGQLPPGEYRILAFDRVDGLEYRNLRAMEKYLSQAQSLRVLPNEQATIRLELTKRGD
ncbi:MAG TPA: hypothetical protein VGQ11_11070, partial [Candidatus Acidoferrales bacterium]|nr:hypothetical protein [Candidatus Acidoferrales bacterium]